jgi:hypothetical protein
MRSSKFVQAMLVALVVSAMVVLPAAASQKAMPYSDGGSITRSYGTKDRWWATDAVKGLCRGHDPKNGQDWIVYYSANNSTWRSADIRNVYWWSGYVPLLVSTSSAQVESNSLSSGGGLKVCLHGVFSKSDVMNTWIWKTK